MLLRLCILAIVLAILIVLIVVIYRLHECCKSEKFNGDDPVYQFDLAYNNCYSAPRPHPINECPEYNEWVVDSNQCGKNVLKRCHKFQEENPEVKCPKELPWLPAKCSKIQPIYNIRI